MPEATLVALAVVVGAVLGGAVTWLAARSHLRGAAVAHVAEARAELAREQARTEQLQRQVEARTAEVARLQDRLGDVEKTAVQAETRLEEARRNLEEQRTLLDQARDTLHGAFADLSAKALRESKDDFLQLAEQKLGSHVTSMLEQLKRYEEQVSALETKRERAYGGLKSQIAQLAESSVGLEREARNLVTALRTSSQVRGRWGEVALRRVVELAGMVEHCDYVEQVHVEGDEGRLRPDMVVHLPNGRQVIVDAKAPPTAYFDSLEATTDEERQAALLRHAQQVRQHMNALAAKAYWDEFAKSADFVVMFIPGESFVAAAAHADGSLIEDGMAKRVVVATPTTLIALLRAMHYGWRQEQLAKNAEKIRDLGNVLYERLRKFLEHLEKVGSSLGRAVNAYNDAVGSMEARVLPPARDFRKLGASGGDEIERVAPIDYQPRELAAPEFPKQLDVTEPPA